MNQSPKANSSGPPSSRGQRLYRALLFLYPASFRREYADELCAAFSAQRERATGPFGRGALWLGAVADIASNAFRVHADILGQDLKVAARTVRRSPGFAATVVAVTALGVGATTATFSVTDHVLLKPLPYQAPERLVKLWQDQTPRGYPRMEPSPANYRDWKAAATSFQTLAAYTSVSTNLSGEGEPQRLDGASIEPELFPMLGSTPLLGRGFAPEDGVDGAPATAILSDGLWRSRFGGDRSIVGRQILLDGGSTTVLGVMPPHFSFPDRSTEIWLPLRFRQGAYEDRNNTYLRVVARLRDGVTLEQARSEMSTIGQQLESAHPVENAQTGVAVDELSDDVSWRSRQLLWTLFAAALCVLLVAATNLANLLLARGLSRRRELALRSTLGAGRERLVRQALTESLLLALTGGGLGVLVAIAATPLVVRLVPNSLPIAETPPVDLRVLGFALGVSSLVGIGFGLLPALRASRGVGHLAGDLREGARSGVGGRHGRLRSTLVVSQMTISVVLLVGCGLLMRALLRVQATDPGFRSAGVISLRTTLPFPKYAETARRQTFYQRVLGEVRALPGVESAGYASFLPMVMRGGIWPVSIDGQAQEYGENSRSASLRYVTPGFFAALGIPVKAGRDVQDGDTHDAPWVAVVSESFVRQHMGDGPALDRSVEVAFGKRRVVGVVGDVKVRGLERESEPQIYVAVQQIENGYMAFYAPKDLVVRVKGDGDSALATLLPALRRIVRAADPDQPISNPRRLDEVLSAETAPRSAQLRLIGGFGAIALLLAAIGLHGLLAFTLSQRLPEIGVRMALGATRRDVLRLVLRQGVLQATLGLLCGIACALGVGRVLQSLLAGVSPNDAIAFLLAGGLCLFAIAAGSLLPALRAARVDPASVLRAD